MITPETLADYDELQHVIKTSDKRSAAHLFRVMAKNDLYFLLRFVLSTKEWTTPDKKRSFWDHPWLLDRCRDVQYDSENVLDIWARYHCKSTIKTFGENIRCLLNNPNETIGIFSVTKSVADKFVTQIKQELESNEFLKNLFPDVLYEDPKRQAPGWTVEKGFVIKRPMNLKDVSVMGFGLLDTSYTGARISRANYDDAVNESNVTTSDMMEKTVTQWELSLNTGFPGTTRHYIGTFYAHGDPYHTMAKRSGIRLRLHPCFEIDRENSQFDEASGLPIRMEFKRDRPVLFDKGWLDSEESQQSKKTFGIQLLCYPQAGAENNFSMEWLQYYMIPPARLRKDSNVIILVDPANEKKKRNSKTSMWVIGLNQDRRYYILDMIIDRLNLRERTNRLFDLVKKWNPHHVRYEKYSMQADVQHIRHVMEENNFRFNIIEVGGNLSKDDRIARLIPLFAAGDIYLPKTLLYLNNDGQAVDLVDYFVKNEYLVFPNSVEKDALDGLSRLCEQQITNPWPGRFFGKEKGDSWRKSFYQPQRQKTQSWMAQ